MIVYGKRKKKYVLSDKPVSQSMDGTVYAVAGNPKLLAKIYNPSNCTPETEARISAVGSYEVVYINGRFAGYVYENFEPVVTHEPPPPPPTGLGPAGVILISLVLAVAMTALIYFVLYDKLAGMVGYTYSRWNFSGIPMIFGGWALMIFSLLKFIDRGLSAVFIGFVAFVVGSALTFSLICLIVVLVNLAWSLLQLILPIIFAVAIIVWILKALFNNR